MRHNKAWNVHDTKGLHKVIEVFSCQQFKSIPEGSRLKEKQAYQREAENRK